jgi:hypothetical protein
MAGQQDRIAGLIGTLGMKAPCRVASNVNLTLFGAQIVDGAGPFTDGERILVKAQTNPIENGIYLYNTTAEWERAPDFDGSRDIMRGTCIPVPGGVTNPNTLWMLTQPNAPIIGTSPLTFVLIAGASYLGSGGSGGGGQALNVSPFMLTMLDDIDAGVARATINAANLTGDIGTDFRVRNLFVRDAVFLPSGSVVNPSGYLGLGNNNPLSWLHVADVATSPNRHAARIERVANHTGGAAGTVAAALQVLNIVQASTTNREFGVYSILENYALGNYNISGYFGVNKRAAGHSQAGAFEAKDFTTLPDPSGTLNAITASLYANGTDAFGTRIGIELVTLRANPGGTIATITAGLRIGAYDGDPGGSYFINGIRLNSDMQTGILINTSGAHTIHGIWDASNKPIGIKLSGTYSTGAIVLNAGGKLLFDPQGACVSANASFKDIVGFENCWVNFQQGFGVSGGATNIAASATAGNSGGLPVQTSGYLRFKIDGVIYKLPYYNN